jgi:hypothetical protein
MSELEPEPPEPSDTEPSEPKNYNKITKIGAPTEGPTLEWPTHMCPISTDNLESDQLYE